MGTPVTTGWENFFVAEAGASAALTGLVFVAVSINLTRILSFPNLPGRAAQALQVLFLVLVISTLGLVPGQSAKLFGTEILAASAVGIFGASWIQFRDRLHAQRGSWVLSLILTSQAPLVPFVVCGVLLYKGYPSALYWLVAGTVFSFVAGVINAWVLLVEILRLQRRCYLPGRDRDRRTRATTAPSALGLMLIRAHVAFCRARAN